MVIARGWFPPALLFCRTLNAIMTVIANATVESAIITLMANIWSSAIAQPIPDKAHV